MMGAVELKRRIDVESATDTSETPSGKRNRATLDAAENSVELHGNRKKRCRVGALYLTFVLEKEVARETAAWRDPDFGAR